MADRKIRVGIIGVGQIGKSHVNNYLNIPEAELVAIADIDEPELRRVGELNKIPNLYTDFRRLLARDDIEAVDVCLHNNYHRPVTEEALRAGKHVYCEKPMAGSYADARSMIETARSCSRQLSIQLAFVFQPETRAARKLIEAGKLGKIYHARSYGFRRRGRPFVDGYGKAPFVSKTTAGGGALFDMGVYHISQILYLLGRPKVERIVGRIYQECDMDPNRREEGRYDVEELGCGFVNFENGLSLDILESWAIHTSPFEGSFISGSQGGIRLSPFSFHSYLCDMVADTTFDLKEHEYRTHQLNPLSACYDSPQQHWISSLLGKVPLEPTAETALLTMLVSDGIYLSSKLGREVSVREIEEMSASIALKV